MLSHYTDTSRLYTLKISTVQTPSNECLPTTTFVPHPYDYAWSRQTVPCNRSRRSGLMGVAHRKAISRLCVPVITISTVTSGCVHSSRQTYSRQTVEAGRAVINTIYMWLMAVSDEDKFYTSDHNIRTDLLQHTVCTVPNGSSSGGLSVA